MNENRIITQVHAKGGEPKRKERTMRIDDQLAEAIQVWILAEQELSHAKRVVADLVMPSGPSRFVKIDWSTLRKYGSHLTIED